MRSETNLIQDGIYTQFSKHDLIPQNCTKPDIMKTVCLDLQLIGVTISFEIGQKNVVNYFVAL